MVLKVTDDGVGIAASRKEEGLGLKLIQIFAAQLGGAVVVSDEKGGTGTVVALTVPAKKVTATSAVTSDRVTPDSAAADHSPF
jgi:two-component sensor histidine kinase